MDDRVQGMGDKVWTIGFRGWETRYGRWGSGDGRHGMDDGVQGMGDKVWTMGFYRLDKFAKQSRSHFRLLSMGSKVRILCIAHGFTLAVKGLTNSKVLLNSFPMNGHTLGFCTWSQKLEYFVSPKVSLWQSKGS